MGEKDPKARLETTVFGKNGEKVYSIKTEVVNGFEMAGIKLDLETQVIALTDDPFTEDNIREDAISANLNEALKWHIRFIEKYAGRAN